MSIENLKAALDESGFMFGDGETGVWCLVDGQFGSTGKGLMAGALAECYADKFQVAACNAGPNSGHTSYLGDRQIVLKQLPTFGVVASLLGHNIVIDMNAGSVLVPELLTQEMNEYQPTFVHVHSAAAIVNAEAVELERRLVSEIGSTGKGTGGAIAAKVLRNPLAVAGHEDNRGLFHLRTDISQARPDASRNRIFLEVSQGYSLGINRGFYPYTTSRNCDVAAAISDGGYHPHDLVHTTMVCRAFPIRVGGNSGPCYPDQREMTWEEVGQTPELTTVTKKQRRIFSWSREQFRQAVNSNRPDVVLINFLNYMTPEDGDILVRQALEDYYGVLGRNPALVIGGYGPKSSDLQPLFLRGEPL